MSTGVSTRTLTVPVAFAPGYHGVQYVYGWAKDGGGVYGSTAVLGNWVARARIDGVAPNPTTVGSTVTLSGDGFGASQGGSIAQVNATPLSVTSWTATSITATVPPGATSGPVTVVTNGTWSNENLTLAIAGDPPGGADEVIYYHSDALGSVRMITDATGAVVARYDYLPFGQPYPSDQDAEPRRFGQLERTAGTGNGSWTLLDYALARHYHSQSGRFTTPDDPTFGDPFDPQSMNLYAYARNNPLRFIDPSGHNYCPPSTDTSTTVCEEAPHVDIGTLRFFWDRLLRPVIAPETAGDLAVSVGVQVVVGAAVTAVTGGSAAPAAVATVGRTVTVFRAARATGLLNSARGNLLQGAQNPKLRNLISQMYRRNARIGSGSTADAIRHEFGTGELLSKSGHFTKGQEMRTALARLIREGNLDPGDAQIAHHLLSDLQRALSGL